MTNYFVKSHYNNRIYISNDKPENITEVCKECGERDTILFSFDDKDINEPEKTIKEIFTKDLVLERSELIKQIDSYYIGNMHPYTAVTEARCHAITYTFDNRELLNEMFSCGCINKKSYDEILKYLNHRFKKYMELIDFINYGMIILNRRAAKVKVKEK